MLLLFHLKMFNILAKTYPEVKLYFVVILCSNSVVKYAGRVIPPEQGI